MSQINESINELRNEDTMKGMFISFSVNDVAYALEIRYVLEIIGMQAITQVPQVPAYVKGIINKRGTIIPLIDMRLRFSYPEKEYDERTCIIDVMVNDLEVGLIVDEVQDVAYIDDDQISSPPLSRTGAENSYIQGVARIGDVNRLIIDVKKLFAVKDTEALGDLA